jgi:uncharacterized protein YfiM (DUF2279 family)
MIPHSEKGERHVQEPAHGSADHRGAEADGSRAEGGGCGTGSGRVQATIYAWKAKYGGMDVSQAQEAKQLRGENTRLRKLVADLSLDQEALQSVIRKTGWSS